MLQQFMAGTNTHPIFSSILITNLLGFRTNQLYKRYRVYVKLLTKTNMHYPASALDKSS